jgi:hypothetical protein
MRLHLVYDKNGKILGGGLASAQPGVHGFRNPGSGPDAGDDQHVGEFDVPAEHRTLALHDLAERLQVDVRSRDHKLVSKGG